VCVCVCLCANHVLVCVCVCVCRVPLHKQKSMRESLREQGVVLPYQDPALKYQANEYAGSASMYINNYADVGTPSLIPPHLCHFHIYYAHKM